MPFGLPSAVDGVVREPVLLVVFGAVAVLSSVLPYALEMLALRRMPTRVFGVLQSLGPAIAALAGLLILHEALAPHEIVALACVTAASVGVTRPRVVPGAPEPEAWIPFREPGTRSAPPGKDRLLVAEEVRVRGFRVFTLSSAGSLTPFVRRRPR